MVRKLAWMAGSALALVLWPQGAGASGDYGCTPSWSLQGPDYECAGTALIGPRNDTRINLAWLLQDSSGTMAKGRYPKDDWDTAAFGHVFLSWEAMQQAFWPRPEATEESWDDSSYAGSICQTYASGAAAFRAALDASSGLKGGERDLLSQARDQLKPACDGDKAAPLWPEGISSPSGRDFLAYLKGAQAFYAEDFLAAASLFSGLSSSREPWIAETARYMLARNALAGAQATAQDEWGWYDNAKVDKAQAEAGRTALEAYLAAYPEGRYAASAQGLTRRALWMMGAPKPLSQVYAGLLAREPFSSEATPRLLEEVENKLFFTPGLDGNANAGINTPLLLATWDLARLRTTGPLLVEYTPKPLSAEELEAQAPVFAGHPDLFGYLKAVHAFYKAKDYRRVLQLLPDDARRESYAPLAFSRQLLRGLALEQLGDANAAGFWQQLHHGANPLYQRSTVELALAMHWERKGQVDKVFATGSPVGDVDIRAMLLEQIAGPDLLRQQAEAGALSVLERKVATFTLLYKDLSRARYTDFNRDLTLVPASAGTDGWIGGWLDDSEHNVPTGLFTKGNWTENYPCPALSKTTQVLAANARDVHAQLCLAEFYRLNGFDDYLAHEGKREASQLGGTPSHFPGKALTREAIYASVLADRSAAAPDTAYALYRSVMCYAPSGNNSCSAGEVPVSQRKAWFDRLKREFPKSPWAIRLKYYW